MVCLSIKLTMGMFCGWPFGPPFFCGFNGNCFNFMKNPQELKKIVEDLAFPLVEVQGLEIWGLDIICGPTLKVCLYVDGKASQDDQLFATIDQCERISRQLGLALDVEDIIDHAWTLEVSSPGLERKFYTLEQMRPYAGSVVDIRLADPLPGSDRRVWRGKLAEILGEAFRLEPCSVTPEGEIVPGNEEVVEIPWNAVAKAQRVYVFTVPQKPGKKAAKKKEK